MNEQTRKRPDPRLRVGSSLIFQKGNEQVKASITALTEEEIGLELSREGKALKVKKEDAVRIKYWDEQGIYFCGAQVVEVSGSEVTVSIVSEPVAMQRRGVFRLSSEMPISFKVTESVHKALASQKVFQSQTRNISVGGLSFDTSLPLKETDLLELELTLPSSEKIGTTAEVVTSATTERDGKSVTSIGVEFFHLRPETRNLLLEFLLQAEPVE
ncbi:PilZ domain-containing protein [Acidobacteria bacterium AH-259-D05]|nr:PilZ domain-containing protein [Acidobacteria bacterium AH-259-D05]